MTGTVASDPASSTLGLKVHQFVDHLRDPLYRNGYALMLNTAFTSGLGVIYWVVANHIYGISEVGRISALVAAMTLISALTQMNFGSVLIRFLARAGRSSYKLILATYLIAAGFAAVASATALIVINMVVTSDSSLRVSFGFGVWFVIATAGWSVFCLQDSVLTGLRRSIWVPIENVTFAVVKIVLLVVFFSAFSGDGVGIFASWTVPVTVSLIPINLLIFRRILREHVRDTAHLEQPLDLRLIRSFVAGDYLSSLFAQAMTTLMPVIVAGVLGEKPTAYFYIAQTISLSLDLVAWNLANSMTAEAAGHEHRTADMAKAILRRTLMIVVPIGFVVFVLAPYILAIYDSEYRENATWLLRLLVLAAIPRIALVVYSAVARLEHKTNRNAILASVQAVLMIGGSVFLMKEIGIVGVGYAALISQTIAALIAAPWLIAALRRQSPALPPDPEVASV